MNRAWLSAAYARYTEVHSALQPTEEAARLKLRHFTLGLRSILGRRSKVFLAQLAPQAADTWYARDTYTCTIKRAHIPFEHARETYLSISHATKIYYCLSSSKTPVLSHSTGHPVSEPAKVQSLPCKLAS